MFLNNTDNFFKIYIFNIHYILIVYTVKYALNKITNIL